MSRDEIIAEIVERPRDGFMPLPDLQLIERPGWRQLVTPSVKRGGFNEVSFARLTEGEADTIIDATIEQYRKLGCKFVWRVGPDSAPADLVARLARGRLVHGVACGMARSTEMESVDAPHIRVAEVDESTVELYTDTMAAGWKVDAAPLLVANRVAIGASKAGATFHLFLAYCDGEAAATAGSIVFERSVYLVGGVTVEKFRGRGLYRALVEARLRHARGRGVMLATSHARAESSAPILERMGFETLVRYDNFSG